MTTELMFSQLNEQLKAKHEENRTQLKRWVAAAVFLQEEFQGVVGQKPGYESNGLRQLLWEFKHGTTFEEAMDALDSAGDYQHEDVMELLWVCQMLAGIRICSDDADEWAEKFKAAERCDECARAYVLVALSACVLTSPLSEWMAMETAHATDRIYSELVVPMNESLDALIPPGH